jgi:hypothetical protein
MQTGLMPYMCICKDNNCFQDTPLNVTAISRQHHHTYSRHMAHWSVCTMAHLLLVVGLAAIGQRWMNMMSPVTCDCHRRVVVGSGSVGIIEHQWQQETCVSYIMYSWQLSLHACRYTCMPRPVTSASCLHTDRHHAMIHEVLLYTAFHIHVIHFQPAVQYVRS